MEFNQNEENPILELYLSHFSYCLKCIHFLLDWVIYHLVTWVRSDSHDNYCLYRAEIYFRNVINMSTIHRCQAAVIHFLELFQYNILTVVFHWLFIFSALKPLSYQLAASSFSFFRVDGKWRILFERTSNICNKEEKFNAVAAATHKHTHFHPHDTYPLFITNRTNSNGSGNKL